VEDLDIDEKKVFRVTTNTGVRYAYIVISAIGPGNAPTIPNVIGLPTSSAPHEGYSHAMHLKKFPPPHVAAKIKLRIPTNIIIVGGGLTSIQLADLAIKRGVSRVWLLMRGGVKVKYFDIDLDWVGKFRNFNQAAFWSADTDEGKSAVFCLGEDDRRLTVSRTPRDVPSSSQRWECDAALPQGAQRPRLNRQNLSPY